MTSTEGYRLSVKYGATPTSTIVVPSTKQAEFERFEDMTQKLLRVPKHALDEERTDS